MRWLLLAALWLPLGAQDFSRISIEKFAGGYRFTEGPAWSRDGYLLFSDVPAGIIVQAPPGGRRTVFRDHTQGASGNALDAQGRLYSCETRGRRVVRADRKGNIEVLAERWEGKRLNAPNDIALRKDGNAYFTDPAFGYQSDSRELDFYGVYQITPKRELRLVAKPVGRPDGIALSPDGRVLYVANADERNVRAYDLDGRGAASGERVFIAKTGGIPNGLRTDDKGNLYVAATTLDVYTPAGKTLASLPMPEPPSGCAFGDGETLYVTARTSVYRIQLK